LKHLNLFFQILLHFGAFFSSKALGRDPEDSDLEEVIISESETESDEDDKLDDPSTSDNNQQHFPTTEDVTGEAPTPQTTSQQDAPPTPQTTSKQDDPPSPQTTSQPLELLPLLSDQDSSIPENVLIEREFQAMEEESRQVTSLPN